MKALFLTFVLALSVNTVAFAGQTEDLNCEAFEDSRTVTKTSQDEVKSEQAVRSEAVKQ